MAEHSSGAAGPSAAAAAVPAAGAAQQVSWWATMNQQMASTRAHMARMAAELQAASKTWRAPDFSKGLGVKLDVDMLSPAVATVKQQYEALPEPVREVMPFAGVATVTGLAVSKLYGHQLHQAQKRYGVLQQDHEQLQAQVKQLEAQLGGSDLSRTTAQLQVQMAEAVAKATTAAAAAATAAAAAAAGAAAGQQHKDSSRGWP